MQNSNRFSFTALIFACLFLVATAFFIERWNWVGSWSLISWDVSGYYMYLPAFFYDDPAVQHNQQYIIHTYHPCNDFLCAHIGPTGKYVMKYSCGMAITYLPGFAVGHLVAKLGGYPVDGYSWPYQFSMAMYSLLVAFIGLWLCRKVLLKYFQDKVVALVLLALVLATNYLNYTAIVGMMSHGYLFTIYSLIILLTIQWHKKYDYPRALAIGALCGLCALIRPTEVISIIIPVLWGVSGKEDVINRFKLFVREYRKILLMIVGAVTIGSIQLIYWKVFTGHFLYWSYGDDDGLNFLKVHVWNCLFSYRKGWFVYTPFMLLSVIGFITLFKKDRKLFWTSFAFTFIALYIVFSWKAWSYGGSFSMRAVVQYYAILVFPLASLIEYCSKRIFLAIPVAMFSVFCVWLNLVMHWQANGGDNMDCDNETGKYYWKVFGQLHSDGEFKKFLDTDEEIPAKKVTLLRPVLTHHFCEDTTEQNCVEYQGSKCQKMTEQVSFIPEMRIALDTLRGKWIRVSCNAFIEKGSGNYWTQPQIYAWAVDANLEKVKEKGFRLERIAPYQSWGTFNLDIFVPSDEKVKYLKAGIFNPGGKGEVYVKDITISSVNE
jgi:hypothetical protein